MSRRSPMEPGARAPYFSMVTAGSGRRVSLRSCAGRPLVLVFHGRENAEVVRRVNHTIRPRFPEPDSLTIASVIDLSFVPPFYWTVANVELDRAYREATAELPEDVDPKDYVLILPDWAGSTTRKFRVANAAREAAILVFGADSRVLGSYSGEGAEEAALSVLGG
ncbi:MAG: hypothetical protein ACR2KW_09475 [Rubrobacter sp.]